MRIPRILLFLFLTNFLTGALAKNKEVFPAVSSKGFTQNKGQIFDQNSQPNNNVLFLWNGPGMNVQLRKTGFSYDVWQKIVTGEIKNSRPKITENESPAVENFNINFHRIDFEFERANENISITSYDETGENINYYLNSSDGVGITGIRQFQKVVYNNVWKGIDIEFLLAEDKPKYNIIVHSGAKISDINFKISGADNIAETNGQLTISNTINDITEKIPESYFLINGNKIPVITSFKKIDDSVFGITLSENNLRGDLIIDPIPNLNWCTYYGGNNNDVSYSISTDGSGNTIITGSTKSTSNIASSGAYQTTYGGGNYDVFVAKFNSSGQRVWSTFYGGTGDEESYALSGDASGNYYVTGYTNSSSGLSTTGALYQATYNGNSDAFLVKFNSSGNLIWATYFGGTNPDYAFAVATDIQSNIIISGYTSSTTTIATAGAQQTTLTGGGSYDCFLAKFNSSGQKLWGTYYGGTGTDNGRAVTTDNNDNIIMSGYTSSASGIATAGTYKQTPTSAAYETFVVKFYSSGLRAWGTYFGGSGNDYNYGVKTDVARNIYITGQTYSGSGISTNGSFQQSSGGGADGMLVKFDTTGQLLWSTYLGGSGTDDTYSMTVDGLCNIYVIGSTTSSGLATSLAFQTTYVGGNDAIIYKFDSSGTRLWSTYYGGGGDDYGFGITFDGQGKIVITGSTNSVSGFTTSGVYQTTYGGGTYDSYVTNFAECIPGFGNASSNSPLCSGASLNLTAAGGSSYDWSGPKGFTSTLQSPVIPNADSSHSGTYTVIIGNGTGCTSTKFVNVLVYPFKLPKAGFSQNALNECFNNNSFLLQDTSTVASGSLTRIWKFSNGDTSTSSPLNKTFSNSGIYSVKLIVTSGFTCADSVTKTLTIYPQTQIGYNVNNSSQCFAGNSFSFTDTSTITSGTFTRLWYFGDGTNSVNQTYNKNYISSGNYTSKLVTTTNNGCLDSIQKTINVYASPASGFTINNPAQCLNGNSFLFTDTSKISTGTLTRSWSIDGGTPFGGSPFLQSYSTGLHTIKLVETSNNNCLDSTTKTFTVYPQTNIGFTINNPDQCSSSNNFVFTDTSSGSTYTRLWYLGDGSNAVSSVVNKNYIANGTYNVKLVTTTINSCIDSIQKTVNVNPQPTAGYTQTNLAQCLRGNSFLFTDTSKISSGTLVYHFYRDGVNISNGPQGGGFGFAPLFFAPGAHTIKEVVQSDHNCFDSTSKTFTIYPQTDLGFTVNGSSQCLTGNNFTFTDTSSGIYTRLWDLGDASTASSQVVNKSYVSSGSYNVKLTSTTSNGCIDSVTKNVIVNNFPQPVVGFTQNNFAQCLSGNGFLLSDTSTISSGTISRQWNFNDGGSSVANNFSKSFLNPGSFTIKLIETSNNGCKDSVTKSFTVYPQTTIGFNTNNYIQCFNTNSFIYSDTSTISSGSYTRLWRLGDGTTSALSSVTKSYSSTGILPITLVTTTNNGCMDSVQKNITINVQPLAGFTQNNFAQCLASNSFNLNDTSLVSSGTYTVLWKFSDATTSTSNTINKTFLSDGIYSAKLIATSQSGCSDSVSKNFTIHPQTNIGYNASAYSQCFNGNNFTFNDTSSVSSGSFSRLWKLGDGSTSTSVSVNKSYLTEGTFNVKLITTTNNNCMDSVEKNVLVKVQPKAGYTQNNFAQCLTGNSFTLTDTSLVSSGTKTVLWKFSDATTFATSVVNKSFATAGTFSAILVSTSQSGCSDSVSKNFTVHPQTNIDFNSNNYTQCFAGNSFTLNDNSSVSSGSYNRFWKLGDGTTSNSVSFNKSYLIPGTYSVNLITTTNNGCVDSLQKTLTVNAQPVAGFTQNNFAQCLTGNSFSLSDTTLISSGTYTRNWKFSDNDTSTSVSFNKSFSISGSFTTKLIATSQFGCADSVTKTFTVHPQTNIGFIIANPSQCLQNNLFSITDTSSISSGTYSRLWNFGDGSTGSTVFINKSYAAAGIYTINLITTSNNGCIDSAQKIVTLAIQPKAGFSQNNLSECFNGNSFSLSDTSTISSGTYTRLWQFGNGDTSTLVSPVQSYSSPGTYTVKLLTSSSVGCSDSVSKTLNIYQQTNVGFSVSNSIQCFNGNNFVFMDTSFLASGSYSRSWTLGDGSTSGSYLIGKIYSTPGTFPVQLKTVTNNGCMDSVMKFAIVYAQPKAGFTQNNFAQCFTGNNFLLNDTSTNPTGAYIRNWYFSDNQTDTASSINKTFNAGIISAKLLVTSPSGCSDSVIKTFTVYPQVNIGFYTNNSSQCQSNNSFLFSDTSTVSSGTFSRQWNFGDATSATGIFFNKSYSAFGNYTVSLTTITNNGCMDSVKNFVNVFAQPHAGFTQNNFAQCLTGNNFNLTDTTTISSGTFSRFWKFSDGDTSTSISVNKSFANFSSYTAKLLIATDKNCLDSVSKSFTVYPQTGIGYSLSGPSAQCYIGNNFVFDDTSVSYSGTYSRQWDFGDGSFNNLQHMPKSFVAYGNYIVKLTTTTVNGCVDSLKKPMVVYPQPYAAFTLSSSGMCLTGNSFILNDTSVIPLGTFKSYWYFSNGDTTTVDSFSKSFTQSGNYRVSLYIISDKYCIDSAVKSISVYPNPLVGFSQNDSVQCFSGNKFLFTDTSKVASGTLGRWWDFGDATVDSNLAESKTYSASGSYTVKLIVQSGEGCFDSLSKNFTVNPNPKAMFTQNNAAQCLAGNSFTLNDISFISSGNLSRYWDLGDSSFSNKISLNKSFSKSGSYTIKLVSISDNNCRDSVMKSFAIYPKPAGGFSVNQQVQCFNENNFVLKDTTLNTSSRIWYFGDTTFAYSNSVSKKFNTSGYFNISLKVTDINNCTDSVSKVVTVDVSPAKPDLQKLSRTQLICSKANKYLWYFENDSVTNSNIQILNIDRNGLYRVKVISTNGCYALSDSIYIINAQFSSTNGNIMMMPNPARDKAIFEFNGIGGDKVIEIFNSSGMLVQELTGSELIIEFPLDNFTSGLYLVRITTQGGTMVKKLLVE